MSIEDTLGNLFKPEVKSSGRKLVAQQKISLASKSETDVQAYVKVTPPFKVNFTAEDINSCIFVAGCNCPVAKKNRFCKHIWATLLCVEEEYPDFLVGKTEIKTTDSLSEAPTPSKQDLYKELQKQRASAHRKEQYQKQKEQIKAKKLGNNKASSRSSIEIFSEEVNNSIQYFSQNGFPMISGPTEEILSEAKRKLSRFFHPDRGGTHEESIELNKHCDILRIFLQR